MTSGFINYLPLVLKNNDRKFGGKKYEIWNRISPK